MPNQLLATIRNGKIEPFEPIALPEGTQVIVTIDPAPEDLESKEWQTLSLQCLSKAYSDDEPDYEISQIKEFNPDYRGK